MAGGDLVEAIAYWKENLTQLKPEETEFSRMKALLGISLLDAEPLKPYRLRLESIDEAFTHLGVVKAVDQETAQISAFVSDWQNRKALPQKSPWLAGSLSVVVPGSGSFYAGRYVEGTYAFLITSLFILATADALADDRQDLGLVFGLFSLGFYGGSIYTAINGVHKLNDKTESDQLRQIRQKHGIWFIPETGTRKGRF